MTFSRKGGYILLGTFNSDFLEYEFTGVKLEMANLVKALRITINS